MFEFFEKHKCDLPELDRQNELTQADIDRINAKNPPFPIKSKAHLLCIQRNRMLYQNNNKAMADKDNNTNNIKIGDKNMYQFLKENRRHLPDHEELTQADIDAINARNLPYGAINTPELKQLYLASLKVYDLTERLKAEGNHAELENIKKFAQRNLSHLHKMIDDTSKNNNNNNDDDQGTKPQP